MEQHTKKIEYQQQQQQPKTECQASEQGECEREGLRGQKETALSRTKTKTASFWRQKNNDNA